MKIFDFIKGLVPRFNKSSVLEDLRITSSEIDTVVLPSYQVGSEHFKVNKPKSEVMKSITNKFYKEFTTIGSKKANIVEEIYRRFPYIKENLTYTSVQLEELLEKDIIKDGLTAKKAVLIRAADAFNFLSRYSLDLINYMYVEEGKVIGTDMEDSLTLAPGVVKNVDANLIKFARLLSIYGIPNTEYIKSIDVIPEVVLNNNTHNSVSGVYGEQQIDPFSRGYVQGFTYNPIYIYGKYNAEVQALRYKSTKDKKKLLELRILQLQLLKEDRNDPKLEQEIEYIQSRVDKLTRQLQDIEESI